MYNKTVVLAGDYGYINQIETTLKSLCLHNDGLDIYVFNQDIPQEWFFNLATLVNQSGNNLNDIKLSIEQIAGNWYNDKLPHINYMTFARYFISTYLEQDTVVYLDSDLVVTQDITPLFDLDLSNHYVAAARNLFGTGKGFNAGVLVVNNKLWRANNMTSALLEKTSKEWDTIGEGDQTVLNRMFEGHYLLLPDTYNFQIGYEYGAFIKGLDFILDIPVDPLPAIIHYISGIKPWRNVSNMRLREVWWYYNGLQWQDIITKTSNRDAYLSKDQSYKRNAWVFTASDQIEHIDDLIKAAPNCLFHISAETIVSQKLKNLLAYPNVRLYQSILPPSIKKLETICDTYLDINHGNKIRKYAESFSIAGKAVYAFDNTVMDNLTAEVYDNNNWKSLAQKLTEDI